MGKCQTDLFVQAKKLDTRNCKVNLNSISENPHARVRSIKLAHLKSRIVKTFYSDGGRNLQVCVATVMSVRGILVL